MICLVRKEVLLAFDTVFNTIRSRWEDNVATPVPLLTQYDNDYAFVQPESGRWARLFIMIVDTSLEEISAYRIRHTGTLVAWLHNSIGLGDSALLTLFDTINPFFRNRVEGTITWRQPTIVRIGTVDKWYRINVIMPFHFDEFHS